MNFEKTWRGRLDYELGWQQQLQCADQVRREEIPNQIWGLEHPHVITLGKRSRLDPEIPQGPIVWVDRGGEATVHSEGQLVIYPIAKLRPHFQVRTWVDFLHVVTEQAFARAGIEVRRGPHSGLWSRQGKIAFLGLRIKEGVSLHGLSINVHNNLALFGSIKSCGVRSASLDSLQNQGFKLLPAEFFELWGKEFDRHACQISKS